jgi:hypothetical protein
VGKNTTNARSTLAFQRLTDCWALLGDAKLFADPVCWDFVEQYEDEFMSYGCGPGGVGDYLVPDTMWGLYIGNACRIHDWYYRWDYDNYCEARRNEADRILKNNSIRIINRYTHSNILRKLRYRRAQTYYTMVHNFGANAYWEDRNV